MSSKNNLHLSLRGDEGLEWRGRGAGGGAQRAGTTGGQLVDGSGKKGELGEGIELRISSTRQAGSSRVPAAPLKWCRKSKYGHKKVVMEAAKAGETFPIGLKGFDTPLHNSGRDVRCH